VATRLDPGWRARLAHGNNETVALCSDGPEHRSLSANPPIAPHTFSATPGEEIAFFGEQANNMGIGITVGSTPITRAFTIHTDTSNSSILLNGGGAAGVMLNMDTGTVGIGTYKTFRNARCQWLLAGHRAQTYGWCCRQFSLTGGQRP
jgi:hypothetical protein